MPQIQQLVYHCKANATNSHYFMITKLGIRFRVHFYHWLTADRFRLLELFKYWEISDILCNVLENI